MEPTPTARRCRRWFPLAAVAMGLAGASLVGEVAFRIAGRRPLTGEPSLLQLWVNDPHLGWRNKPNAVLHVDAFGTIARTGSFGERKGLLWSEDRTRPGIVFVGDSTTFCAEVNDDESGPSRVASRLPASLGVRVVNAGVRGHSTLQAVRMTAEWCARGDVRLVVYTFCENDLVENVLPWYLPARSPVARLDGDALAIEEPGVRAEEAGRPVHARSRLSDLVLALRQRSALFSDLWPRARRLLARTAHGPAAPPENGEARRQSLERHPREVLVKLVASLDSSVRASGAKLLVTRFTTSRTGRSRFGPGDDLPEKGWDDLVALCRSRGIACVDPAPAFGGDETRYLAHALDGTLDAHYGVVGADTWASAVAPAVIAAIESRGR